MLTAFSNPLKLYLVTDEQENLYSRVEAALRGGVTCVQLRLKEASFDTFLESAQRLKQLCQAYQVPFIINDHAEIAKRVQADALHIGQKDISYAKARETVGAMMPIGVSVHTVDQAVQAEQAGAAYLGVGAMFATPSKQDSTLVTLQTLEEIQAHVQIPIVVIGGINQRTLPLLLPYQPDGVAIISAILDTENPEQSAQELYQQLTG